MAEEHKPLPAGGTQWEEGRGFARLYTRDPHTQARFMKAMIGFRACAEMYHRTDVVEAADVVLNYFAERFPDFLTPSTVEEQSSDIFRQDYEPDTFLLQMLDLIAERKNG